MDTRLDGDTRQAVAEAQARCAIIGVCMVAGPDAKPWAWYAGDRSFTVEFDVLTRDVTGLARTAGAAIGGHTVTLIAVGCRAIADGIDGRKCVWIDNKVEAIVQGRVFVGESWSALGDRRPEHDDFSRASMGDESLRINLVRITARPWACLLGRTSRGAVDRGLHPGLRAHFDRRLARRSGSWTRYLRAPVARCGQWHGAGRLRVLCLHLAAGSIALARTCAHAT